MDLYIYYKVRQADHAALHRAVSAMQSELGSLHGVTSQLKRRPQPADDGVWTWMEIYPDVRDGFDAVLADAVQAHGLPALTASPRHTEIFTDI